MCAYAFLIAFMLVALYFQFCLTSVLVCQLFIFTVYDLYVYFIVNGKIILHHRMQGKKVYHQRLGRNILTHKSVISPLKSNCRPLSIFYVIFQQVVGSPLKTTKCNTSLFLSIKIICYLLFIIIIIIIVAGLPQYIQQEELLTINTNVPNVVYSQVLGTTHSFYSLVLGS